MIEERVIASWKFKKGVLDAKTHADILKVWQD